MGFHVCMNVASLGFRYLRRPTSELSYWPFKLVEVRKWWHGDCCHIPSCLTSKGCDRESFHMLGFQQLLGANKHRNQYPLPFYLILWHIVMENILLYSAWIKCSYFPVFCWGGDWWGVCVLSLVDSWKDFQFCKCFWICSQSYMKNQLLLIKQVVCGLTWTLVMSVLSNYCFSFSQRKVIERK